MKKLHTRVLVGASAAALAVTGFVGVTHATESGSSGTESKKQQEQIQTNSGEVSAKAAGYCTTTKSFKKNNHSYSLPVDSSGKRGCTMNQGANGKHVSALQTALKVCYKKGIAVDGVWGPKTTAALKAAQKTMGVSADGVFGPNTNAKTKWRAVLNDPNNPVGSCRTF